MKNLFDFDVPCVAFAGMLVGGLVLILTAGTSMLQISAGVFFIVAAIGLRLGLWLFGRDI